LWRRRRGARARLPRADQEEGALGANAPLPTHTHRNMEGAFNTRMPNPCASLMKRSKCPPNSNPRSASGAACITGGSAPVCYTSTFSWQLSTKTGCCSVFQVEHRLLFGLPSRAASYSPLPPPYHPVFDIQWAQGGPDPPTHQDLQP